MALELTPHEITRMPPGADGSDAAAAAQRSQRAVDRALSDLRRGEPVLVEEGDGRCLLVLAAELVTEERLDLLVRLAGGRPGSAKPALAISGQRARALGLQLHDVPTVLVTPPGGLKAELARLLADPATPPVPKHANAGPVGMGPVAMGQGAGWLVVSAAADPDRLPAEGAALALAKLARLLPAAVVLPVPGRRDPLGFARRHDLLHVSAADVALYRDRSARSLHQVVEAAVPLEDSTDVRLVAFRPSDGGAEHLAIVIGDLAAAGDAPVLVRLHSECFTGDLLGSLRCDCGPQLRGAIAAIAREGRGVVLYLAQEGRGIGLMNKLRAYRLQDGGLDTVDANTALGFESDERLYMPAAAMLRGLGIRAVRLMTNNPDKLAQLARCGVAVVERVPHIFPPNDHNRDYLRTKAERSGHMF